MVVEHFALLSLGVIVLMAPALCIARWGRYCDGFVCGRCIKLKDFNEWCKQPFKLDADGQGDALGGGGSTRQGQRTHGVDPACIYPSDNP